MYVWVILATFLAMLASYTLSSRPDIREVTVEPLAEAQLGRLISKQTAALGYVAEHTPAPESSSHQVTYVPNKKIDDADIENHMGLQINDKNYESWIFCTSKTNDSLLYTQSAECDLEDANHFLVTMGPIPPRWLNLVNGVPNNDYMNAMRRVASGKIGLGYADDSQGVISHDHNTTNSSWIIKNQANSLVFIPRAITEHPRFRELCEDEICLIYVSGI